MALDFQQVILSLSLMPAGNLPSATPAHQWLRDTGTRFKTCGKRSRVSSGATVIGFGDCLVILVLGKFVEKAEYG
jgi:hypothetical protein